MNHACGGAGGGDFGAGGAAGTGPGDTTARSSPPPPRDQVPSAFDEARIGAVLAAKRVAREQGIAGVLDALRARGRPADRVVAALTYDLETAPFTTNRRQLEELGYTVPAGPCLAPDPAVAQRALWHIVYGLERLGIYLLHTDHLSDQRLLEVLCTRVLVERVRDLAPSGDFSEFIDLSASREETDGPRGPDGLQGPLDHQPDQDDDASEVFGAAGPQPPRLADRDRFLPSSPMSRRDGTQAAADATDARGAP